MFREIAQIILAIQLSASTVSAPHAEQLAKVIQQQSEKIDVDPMIEVAIITHESQWNERAVSGDNEDLGLMQVRAKWHGANARQWLLNPELNIKVGSDIIRRSKDFCTNYLHRKPTTQEWLSVYQGAIPSCKPNHLTKQVAEYANCLVEAVGRDAETDPAFECQKIYYPR